MTFLLIKPVYPLALETSIKDISYRNPIWNSDGSVTYDCVWFGNYWQNDTNGDGIADTNDVKEPIKWRVLSASEGDLFLISDKILDANPYNTQFTITTWEKSTVRSWLNGYGSNENNRGTDYTFSNFINTAFDSSQKSEIKTTVVDNSSDQAQYQYSDGDENNTNDKLFFLSYKDSINSSYGFSASDSVFNEARKAKTSDFARERLAYTNNTDEFLGNGMWWLRLRGNSFRTVQAVAYNGSSSWSLEVDYPGGGIRPALHISPSSTFVSYAGTVCTNGTVNETEPSENYSKCGENAYWTYKDGILNIFGTGNMYDFTFDDGEAGDVTIPWWDVHQWITRVNIGSGITDIGDSAFIFHTGLEEVHIPRSVKKIDDSVFYGVPIKDVYYSGTEEEWNRIAIGAENESLENATIHFGNNLFTLGVNNNSFPHNKRDGGGFYDINSYFINNEFRERLFNKATDGEKDNLKKKIDSEWKGSCYGIAASMSLAYNGNLNLSDIQSGAKNYYEMKKPYLNTKFLSLINYYQLSQYVSAQDRYSVINRHNEGLFADLKNWLGNNTPLSTVLQGVVENLKDGKIVQLSYGHDASGHSILATGIEEIYVPAANYHVYEIQLYDENTVSSDKPAGDFLSLTIPNDYLSFRMTNWKGDVIDQNNYTYLEYITSDHMLTAAKVSNFGKQDDASGHIFFLVRADEQFVLRNTEGFNLTYDGTGFSGDMNVYSLDPICSDGDQSVIYRLELDGNSQYIFDDKSAGSTDFTIYDDTNYAALEGENISCAEIALGKGVLVSGDSEYSFTAYTSAGEEEDTSSLIAVSGNATAETFISVEGTEVRVSSEEVLNNIETKTYTDNKIIIADLNDGDRDFLVKTDGTVSGDDIPVTGVSIPEQLNLEIEESTRLIAELIPSNATYRSISWNSSNDSVAWVSDKGVVTGVGTGTVRITATTEDGGYTAECLVRVGNNDLNEFEINLLAGETRRLSFNNDGQYTYGVKWSLESSEPKNCVTVKNGIVTAKNLSKGNTEGRAVIKAVYASQTVTFNISIDGTVPESREIKDGKKSFKLTAPKSVSLEVGTPKKINIGIPVNLREESKALNCEIITDGICEVGEPVFNNADRGKASRAVIEITPIEAGATYIVWTMKDDNGEETTACTKVLIKKPMTELSISEKSEQPLTLSVGQGKRLTVVCTPGNTFPNDLTFSVKGKGIKVSKSGYVSATIPGESGIVTVKSGKISESIEIKVGEYSGNYITLNKTSVIVDSPGKGAKPKTIAFMLINSKKKADQPTIKWEVVNSPEGIKINENGVVSVSSEANPGCYEIIAMPEKDENDYNSASCELIVK